MHRNWQRVVLQILPATVLGVIAFALVLLATDAPGPGLDPDAVSYLGAAQSLATNGSYRIPVAPWRSTDSTAALAHFPPGYSTVLAIPIVLGMTPVQGARLVEAIAALVTTVLIVVLVTSATNAITASLLVLALFAMTAMHEVHVSVLSEPLYLAYTMFTLMAMVWWPERPLRAGIPAAVAVMTRYAGASLVGAVALWALLRPGTWRARITRAAIAVAPAIVLQLLWVLRTERAHDADDIRKFAIYGNLGPTFRQGLATLTAWLAPDPTRAHNVPYRGAIALAMTMMLIALVYMGYAWLRWAERCPGTGPSAVAQGDNAPRRALRLLRACTLILVCYPGIVLASRVLADPLIPFDERIMSPALLLLMIILAVTTSAWWRRARFKVARVALGVVLVTWWLAAAGATRLEARYALTWGSDFAGQQWRTSPLIAWARQNAAHVPLYTNWPAAVYFYLHRNSHELPRRSDAATITAFADSVRARGGTVLLFGVNNRELVPNDSLFKADALRTILDLGDGSVLGPDPP